MDFWARFSNEAKLFFAVMVIAALGFGWFFGTATAKPSRETPTVVINTSSMGQDIALDLMSARLPGAYMSLLLDVRGETVTVPKRFLNSLLAAASEPNYLGLYTERDAFRFISPSGEGDRWWMELRPGYFVVHDSGKGNFDFLDASRFCSQQKTELLCTE